MSGQGQKARSAHGWGVVVERRVEDLQGLVGHADLVDVRVRKDDARPRPRLAPEVELPADVAAGTGDAGEKVF